MKNKRGEATLAVMFPVVLWLGSFIIVHESINNVDFKTSSFRERKAVEYCLAEGKFDCEATVSAMDKTELLAYIKDTQEQPR